MATPDDWKLATGLLVGLVLAWAIVRDAIGGPL